MSFPGDRAPLIMSLLMNLFLSCLSEYFLFWKMPTPHSSHPPSSCPPSSSEWRYTVRGRELWRLQWKLLMRALTAVLLQIQEAHLATQHRDPFRVRSSLKWRSQHIWLCLSHKSRSKKKKWKWVVCSQKVVKRWGLLQATEILGSN